MPSPTGSERPAAAITRSGAASGGTGCTCPGTGPKPCTPQAHTRHRGTASPPLALVPIRLYQRTQLRTSASHEHHQEDRAHGRSSYWPGRQEDQGHLHALTPSCRLLDRTTGGTERQRCDCAQPRPGYANLAPRVTVCPHRLFMKKLARVRARVRARNPPPEVPHG